MYSSLPADPDEYKICQKRGHVAGPTSMSQGSRTTYQCKWCHVSYWWEVTKELHELNAPALKRQGENDE